MFSFIEFSKDRKERRFHRPRGLTIVVIKSEINIFTISALLAKAVFNLRCTSVVCLCVCAIAENPLPGELETSGQRAYR